MRRSFALWLVDASAGWIALDSHELGEYEHGLTMNVMALTEVILIFVFPILQCRRCCLLISSSTVS